MSKITKISEDYQELFDKVLTKTSLGFYGLDFKLGCYVKSPIGIKIIKSNPVVEFILNEEMKSPDRDRSGIISVFIYETAFDKLTEVQKELIIENTLSMIEYDTEKDKITIKNGFGVSEGMWVKHGDNIVNALFALEHSIRQIDEEEKEAKKLKAEEKNKKQ